MHAAGGLATSPDVIGSSPEWLSEPHPIDYEVALKEMERHVSGIADGSLPERIWLLEHPPVYTAGTSAEAADLIDPRFPVVKAGRGGRYTYHGPGQRVGYVMLDLARRGRDVRRFVHGLEAWVIAALRCFDLDCYAVDGRVGIWTAESGREEKIGAIGVRVRRWVTLHGFSINVAPDLAHFGGIVPCGLAGHGVTSLQALGRSVEMTAMDAALAATFPEFLAGL